jgi:hypothetical protein
MDIEYTMLANYEISEDIFTLSIFFNADDDNASRDTNMFQFQSIHVFINPLLLMIIRPRRLSNCLKNMVRVQMKEWLKQIQSIQWIMQI